MIRTREPETRSGQSPSVALTIRNPCRSVYLGNGPMSNAAKAIQLPEDLQAFAEECVRAGEYATVDEVASADLRLLQRRDERRREVSKELGGIFREMETGTYAEPTDEEFAHAVRERALKYSGG